MKTSSNPVIHQQQSTLLLINAWISWFLHIAGYLALCLAKIEPMQEDIHQDIQNGSQQGDRQDTQDFIDNRVRINHFSLQPPAVRLSSHVSRASSVPGGFSAHSSRIREQQYTGSPVARADDLSVGWKSPRTGPPGPLKGNPETIGSRGPEWIAHISWETGGRPE